MRLPRLVPSLAMTEKKETKAKGRLKNNIASPNIRYILEVVLVTL
jgi:hypothetical protein